MPGPVPSWNTVPVYGTWLQLDGTPHKGQVKFTLNQRIGNTPSDAIFPKKGSLIFTLGTETGSINFDCPVLDDPDNFPDDDSVQILVEETFSTGQGASYLIRPVLAMADNDPPGLDLRTIVVPDNPAIGAASLLRGVPGGVAALDSSGRVVDGSGNPIVGGVASVNGHAGTVVLAASDVGADATGAAAAAQSAAATYTNGQITAEVSARNTAITNAVNALVNGAPGALDTLKELADALADDASFATTITNALALKAPLASPALTGSPTINGHTPVTADQAGSVFAAAVHASRHAQGGADALTSFFGTVNVADYGSKGNGQSGTGSMTNGSATLTASGFAAGDVGKAVVVAGAGAGGTNLTTTISAYTSPTVVTLAATAAATVSGAAISWGTDDTTAIQNAMNYAGPLGLHVFIPKPTGHYVLTGPITVNNWYGLTVRGDGWETTEVRQYADNTPIFRFPVDNTHSVTFERMRLTWAVPQTYALAPRSAAFARDNIDGSSSTSGLYFHSYRDLKIVGGTYGWVILRGISDTTSVNPWWGSEWTRIYFTNMNRGCITFNMGSIGAPCNHISDIKVFQNTTFPNDGNEAAITIRGEAVLETVDIEKWHNQAVYIPSANYVTIRGLHIEHHYVDNNTGGNRLIYIAGAPVEFDGLFVGYDSTDSFSKFAIYTDTNAVVDVRGVVFTTPQHGNSYLFGGSGTPGNARVTARGINPSGPTVDVNVYLWQAGSGYIGNVVAIEGVAPTLRSGDALPSPSATFRYRAYIVPGDGATTADSAVQCLENASGVFSWVTIGSPTTMTAPNVQVFTATGTWTKPTNATVVRVYLIGGGGGGGAGRRGATGTLACGGGGGGGAGRSTAEMAAADLTGTVTVTVGAAGTGGAAQGSDSTDGASGTAGGETSFGAYLFARKGGAGGGGTSTAGTAGAAGGNGTVGGAASGSGGAGGTAQAAVGGASGGAAGGGITAAEAAASGGTSFYPADASNGSSAGGAAGAAGTAGVSRTANEALSGPGGGGGGASTSAAAGAGGAGGSYGGGGGGGGASRNGNASGAGGAGAPGIAVVVSQ